MRWLLVLLAACQTLDTVETTITDHGTVYVCDDGCTPEPGRLREFCWDGTGRELESLLGAKCHEIGLSERAWPALVGCAYCCGDCPRGANASCGAFCP